MSRKTYLERYLSGEYVQVWQELAVLDADEIYREPLFSDVFGVAQKTMRRVRHNLETLLKRWQFLGMEFEYPDEVLAPPQTDFAQIVTKFENELGRLPLSIRAFYEIMGSINFCCRNNAFQTPSTNSYHGSDPLGVYDLSYFVDEAQDFDGNYYVEVFDAHHYDEFDKKKLMEIIRGGIMVNFTSHYHDKDEISGGNGPEFLIKAGADCAVFFSDYIFQHRSFLDSIQFVDYLRLAIEWAGFPGFSLFGTPNYDYHFEADDKLPQLLKDVAKDLLPF